MEMIFYGNILVCAHHCRNKYVSDKKLWYAYDEKTEQ